MGTKKGQGRGVPYFHAKAGHVYIITCDLNDMVYIGKTINRDPFDRWSGHVSQAKSGTGNKLHQAMREIGVEHFKFQPIACALTKSGLDDLEMELIAQYDSDANGYNFDGPTFRKEKADRMIAIHHAIKAAVAKIGFDGVLELLGTVSQVDGALFGETYSLPAPMSARIYSRGQQDGTQISTNARTVGRG